MARQRGTLSLSLIHIFFFACFDICQKIGIHGFRYAEILFLKVDAVGADLDRIER